MVLLVVENRWLMSLHVLYMLLYSIVLELPLLLEVEVEAENLLFAVSLDSVLVLNY